MRTAREESRIIRCTCVQVAVSSFGVEEEGGGSWYESGNCFRGKLQS